MTRARKIWIGVLLVLGALFIVVGVVGPHFIKEQIQSGIRENIVVDGPNAPNFARFQSNTKDGDIPMYKSYTFFQIQNPEEVAGGLEAPQMIPTGPFVFREYKTRYNISWDEHGNTMTFRTWNRYEFDEERSALPLDTNLTVVNLPFQAVLANLGRDWYKELGFNLLSALVNSTLFYTRTARELTLGYEDPLLSYVNTLMPDVPARFGVMPDHHDTLDAAAADKTSLWDTVNTGKANINDAMQFIKWQNKSALTCWEGQFGNTVSGTDGTQFHPGVSLNETLNMFIAEAFRHATAVSKGPLEVEGITLYRFMVNPKEMASAKVVPENANYHQYGPSGVLNVSACANNVPLFLSKAYFLDGSDYLGNVSFTQEMPQRDDIDCYIDVEPITGAVMQAFKRLQVNAMVSPILMSYPKVVKQLIPVFWAEESASVTADLASQFRGQVYLAKSMAFWAQWAGVVVGSALLTLAALLLMFSRSRKEEIKSSLSKSVDKRALLDS